MGNDMDIIKEIKEIYQVVEIYYPCMDGYTPSEKRILKTFVKKDKALAYRNSLESTRQIKMKALEEVGISGYWNKFNDYLYCIETYGVDD